MKTFEGTCGCVCIFMHRRTRMQNHNIKLLQAYIYIYIYLYTYIHTYTHTHTHTHTHTYQNKAFTCIHTHPQTHTHTHTHTHAHLPTIKLSQASNMRCLTSGLRREVPRLLSGSKKERAAAQSTVWTRACSCTHFYSRMCVYIFVRIYVFHALADEEPWVFAIGFWDSKKERSKAVYGISRLECIYIYIYRHKYICMYI